MSSILITGGTGYLGQAITRRLLENDFWSQRICIYSRSEHAQATMRAQLNDDERLRFFVGDVRDQERLERAMHRVDTVIHAAALKRIEVGHYNPDEMVKTNVLGTMNVLEAARRAKVRRLVFVSSDKAFEPISPYGQSKALAESLVLAANRMNLGPRAVVVRYGNVAGSTGSVIPKWREMLSRNPHAEVSITDPECTRFWMFPDQAVALVLDATVSTEELLIPTLQAYRLIDLAAAMDAACVRITGLPAWEKKHESMGPGNCSADARRMSVESLRAAIDVLYQEKT